MHGGSDMLPCNKVIFKSNNLKPSNYEKVKFEESE